MNLLKAEQIDSPAIHQLIEEVLGKQLYGLRPDDVDDDIDRLQKAYFENGGYFWIAKNAYGAIMATVGVYKISNNTCELRKMYLKVAEQGKGYGHLLLNTAMEKAKALGYGKMILKTNSKLTKAIELYRKYGFEFSIISVEDKKQDCDIAMQLDLKV